jgi:hypothetical protein
MVYRADENKTAIILSIRHRKALPNPKTTTWSYRQQALTGVSFHISRL